MICTLEKHRAERMGYADALMFDWRGRVAECTGANIFFVKDGVLHTPTPDCFLDGITRRTVIGLAKKRGLQVIERVIMPDELGSFSECFLVGTAAEVTPVSEIGPQHLQARQDQRDADQRLHRRRPAQEGRGGVALLLPLPVLTGRGSATNAGASGCPSP